MKAPVWLKAFAAQLLALLLACAAFVLSRAAGAGIPPWGFLLLQAASAAGISRLLALPAWWLPMQAAFLPSLVLLLRLGLPPAIYLAAFMLLWLFYRSNTRDRVPLYLSSRATWQALEQLTDGRHRFLDLGCGLGGTLKYLARRHPECTFEGVESAPLPYLVSRLRLLGMANAHVRLGDLWREDLGEYDIVYAFLSPEPMPALWRKARAEMRQGSVLVSSSFEIPGVDPASVRRLEDRRRTRLLIYAPPGGERSDIKTDTDARH